VVYVLNLTLLVICLVELASNIDILGVRPKRLPLQELTNELQNRGIDYWKSK